MKFIVEEYCIASHYLGSLINDDPTGLEDEEVVEFDAWVEIMQDGHIGHWDCDRDSDIARCDVTGLLSDCTTVRFIYREINRVSNDQARGLMYDWHDGGGSALYAAASSGLVKSFPDLYREINAIGKVDRELLTNWLQWWQDTERIISYNGADYYALPWAKLYD